MLWHCWECGCEDADGRVCGAGADEVVPDDALCCEAFHDAEDGEDLDVREVVEEHAGVSVIEGLWRECVGECERVGVEQCDGVGGVGVVSEVFCCLLECGAVVVDRGYAEVVASFACPADGGDWDVGCAGAEIDEGDGSVGRPVFGPVFEVCEEGCGAAGSAVDEPDESEGACELSRSASGASISSGVFGG